LSWAFAATELFVVMADLLIRAHFIDYLPLLHVLMFMVIAWWLSDRRDVAVSRASNRRECVGVRANIAGWSIRISDALA
jgi:hypothetical protein